MFNQNRLLLNNPWRYNHCSHQFFFTDKTKVLVILYFKFAFDYGNFQQLVGGDYLRQLRFRIEFLETKLKIYSRHTNFGINNKTPFLCKAAFIHPCMLLLEAAEPAFCFGIVVYESAVLQFCVYKRPPYLTLETWSSITNLALIQKSVAETYPLGFFDSPTK